MTANAMKQVYGCANSPANGVGDTYTGGHAISPERGSKSGFNALSIVRFVLVLLAWLAIVPFLFELLSVVIATWRYADSQQLVWCRLV